MAQAADVPAGPPPIITTSAVAGISCASMNLRSVMNGLWLLANGFWLFVWLTANRQQPTAQNKKAVPPRVDETAMMSW
jgi:hypothetical protein